MFNYYMTKTFLTKYYLDFQQMITIYDMHVKGEFTFFQTFNVFKLKKTKIRLD